MFIALQYNKKTLFAQFDSLAESTTEGKGGKEMRKMFSGGDEGQDDINV